MTSPYPVDIEAKAAAIAFGLEYQEAAWGVAAIAQALLEERERWRDKIEGLEADLADAVEVAFHRGATAWTRLNYPEHYKRLAAAIRQSD